MTKDIIRQNRFDSVHFPKVTKTKAGFLRGDAVVTKTGVFPYLKEDGTIRRELRHRDDVFKPESLRTIEMIPITDGHPPVFVDADNAAKFSAGYTGENYRILDNKNVSVTLTVTDGALIKKIMSGEKPEISMGYSVDLVRENGIYEGQAYEYRQTNIEYNHLASVDRGRAGRDACFRFDGAFTDDKLIETINQGEKKMSNNIDSQNKETIELKLDAALSASREKDATIELLKQKLQQNQLKLDAMEKANIDFKQQVEDLKSRTDQAVIDQKVKDRFALVILAEPYLSEPKSYIHHTDREIMIAAINAKTRSINDFDGQDDIYLRGKFDALLGVNTAPKINSDVLSVISNHMNEDNRLTSNSGLIKHHIESQN